MSWGDYNIVSCSNRVWSKEWQMLFNNGHNLCKAMHMGYQAEYVTDGSILESVNEENDLGVIISEDMKWDKRCEYS